MAKHFNALQSGRSLTHSLTRKLGRLRKKEECAAKRLRKAKRLTKPNQSIVKGTSSNIARAKREGEQKQKHTVERSEFAVHTVKAAAVVGNTESKRSRKRDERERECCCLIVLC